MIPHRMGLSGSRRARLDAWDMVLPSMRASAAMSSTGRNRAVVDGDGERAELADRARRLWRRAMGRVRRGTRRRTRAGSRVVVVEATLP
eukprot:4376669-Prymnesium_polylepis.1